MTRWLLNNFPTWAIAIVVVGVLVLATLAGLWAIRRWAPTVITGEHNEFAAVMAGVIAAVYGVFLAIAIVALYDQLGVADQQVNTEAAAMARIVRNADQLGEAPRENVRDAVGLYRDAVVGPEWKAMRNGDESDLAGKYMLGIFGAIRSFTPNNAAESSFYDAAVGSANDLIDARRARLEGSIGSLPGTFMILLIGGAVLTIGFTLLFGVSSARLQTAMGVSLAVLLGFCLLATFVLDHPYSGDVAVSKQPYLTGVLSEL